MDLILGEHKLNKRYVIVASWLNSNFSEHINFF